LGASCSFAVPQLSAHPLGSTESFSMRNILIQYCGIMAIITGIFGNVIWYWSSVRYLKTESPDASYSQYKRDIAERRIKDKIILYSYYLSRVLIIIAIISFIGGVGAIIILSPE
jgi:hypothetical protein